MYFYHSAKGDRIFQTRKHPLLADEIGRFFFDTYFSRQLKIVVYSGDLLKSRLTTHNDC